MCTFKITMLVCLCLIVYSNLAYAQKQDYVITKTGDTLKGQFTGKKFQADNWEKPKKLDLDDYKEIYKARDNNLSRAVLLPGSGGPEFITVLESGKINLYRLESTEYSYMTANGHWYSTGSAMRLYVGKGNDSVQELDYTTPMMIHFKSKKKRMNLLAEMLNDNKDVYDKFINEDKFNFGQIRNLVHLYNTGRPLESDGAKDYVVKKNNDTIYCKRELGTYGIISRYRANPKDRFSKIDTTISAYFLANDFSTYLLKTLPEHKRPEFVKLLVKGRINL